MNSKIADKVFRLLFVCIILLGSSWAPSVNAFAEEPLPPRFMLNINNDSSWHGLDAWNWPLGAQVTLTIDNPNTLQNPDYTEIQTMGTPYPGGYMFSHAMYDVNFEGHPGFTITLSDGTQTKTMIVPLLSVTAYDLDADTISGVTGPFVNIEISTCANEDCSEMVDHYITADNNGNWTTDFSGIYNLQPGDSVEPVFYDDDWDHMVLRDWRVPNPQVQVVLNRQEIHCSDWPFGAGLMLTIDDPDNGIGVDYQSSQSVDQILDGDETFALFTLRGQYEIQPGDIVTVTDGTTTKQHAVYHLDLSSLDPETDMFTGTATPGKTVKAYTWSPQNGQCSTTVSGTGDWTITFSDPVCEQPYDVELGSEGALIIEDPNNTATQYFWRVADPWLYVWLNPSDGSLWDIHGYDWPLNTPITMTVDNPNTPESPDYTRVAYMEVPSWGGSEQLVYDVNGVAVHPGDIVTMTGGNITRTHTVTSLRLGEINAQTDTLSGTAEPGSEVSVGLDGFDAWRRVVADDEGTWVADFLQPGDEGQGSFDIQPGMKLQIAQHNGGGATAYGVNVPNPRIFALLGEQHVQARGWLAGTLLTLTIDNPATPQSPDYTGTQVATNVEEWDQGIDWGIPLDVQPGYRITVSGGGITKELVVAHLTVTAVDMEADTVTGTGDPGYEIHVGLLCDDTSCTRRNVYVDDSGNWFADFSVPGHDEDETVFDIRPGSGTGVYQIDEDGDATNVGWNLPYPPAFQVRANGDSIDGWEWTLDETVTIEVNDPLTPDNIDYSGTATVGVADWDPNQTWFSVITDNYDLKAGDTVTVKDENITKQLLVTDFRITNVDLDTDRVYGRAEPGQYVNIWTCWHDNPCVNRDETADANGDWFTDFSVPGEQDWEQETADLQTESWIDSSVSDWDGDQVLSGWYVNNNSAPIANAGPDRVVYAGETITLDASASSDPEAGALTYAWDLDNDGQYNDANSVTVTTSFYQPGNHVVALQVTDEGGSSDTDTVTVVVLAWTIKGFYQPVDMNGAYNTVKGGSTVPLKFEIFAGPTELTDIANVRSLTSAETMCNANVVTDEIELVATGGTSLRYDAASGQFIYNWKTPKAAGKCYRVTLTLMDGSSLVAYFKLK